MRIILFISFIISSILTFSQNTQINPGILWNDALSLKMEFIIYLEKTEPVSYQME